AIAAGATVDPVRRGRRLLRAVAVRGDGGVVDKDVKQRRADQARDRLKLREINELALAGASAVPYSHEHGERAGIAAGHVGVGIAPAGRLFAWMAHEQGVAGQGLERGAVANVVFLRSGVAEARHADRDEVRLNLPEAGVVHAPVAHDPRAEVVDHYVRDS